MARRTDFADIGRYLQERFERQGRQLENDFEKAIYLGALKIKADAQRLAPTDSGLLKNSIGLRQLKDGTKLVYQVGTRASYAKFVHEGTGKYNREGKGRRTPWVYYNKRHGKFFWTEGQKANPFMEKAFDQNIEQVQRLLIRAFRGEL